MAELAHVLLRLVARALGLPPTALDGPGMARHRQSSILTCNNYPPPRVGGGGGSGGGGGGGDGSGGSGRQLRCAAHTDISLLTIVAQRSGGSEGGGGGVGEGGGGLEVQGRDGTWQPVPPTPGTLVVNVGDALSDWCGGQLVSTPHRVAMPTAAAVEAKVGFPERVGVCTVYGSQSKTEPNSRKLRRGSLSRSS